MNMNTRVIDLRVGALLVLACAGVVALLTLTPTRAATPTPITGSLDLGSSGEEVRTLQTLLASSRTVYPAGLVTGYYGPLTKTAVAQFQIAYNLPPVGRVGPLTRAELNTLINGGVVVLDVDAPIITNVQVSTTATGATITWNTSEMALGRVHYDSKPVTLLEVALAKIAPQASGIVAAEQISGTLHTVTLTGLDTKQAYSYTLESTDLSKNVSVTLPASFTTK